MPTIGQHLENDNLRVMAASAHPPLASPERGILAF